jgi:hypothetical protein
LLYSMNQQVFLMETHKVFFVRYKINL